MDRLQQYRNDIVQALLQARDSEGRPKLDERQAEALAGEFSDEELLFGIDFNTPEEVAQLLLDSGLDE